MIFSKKSVRTKNKKVMESFLSCFVCFDKEIGKIHKEVDSIKEIILKKILGKLKKKGGRGEGNVMTSKKKECL